MRCCDEFFFRSGNFSGNWRAFDAVTDFRNGNFSGNWNASDAVTDFFVVKILAGIGARPTL